MNRDRWLLLVSIVIFLGLAAYFLRPSWVAVLMGRKSISMASRPSSPTADSQGAASPTVPQTSIQSTTINEQSPWGRNPFLTEEEEAARRKSRGSDGLQVKAIIVGKPKSVATIDGRTVTVGERIGEETVWEILPDAVVLERDGHKRMIKVSEPAVSVEVKERKK